MINPTIGLILGFALFFCLCSLPSLIRAMGNAQRRKIVKAWTQHGAAVYVVSGNRRMFIRHIKEK